MPSSDAPVIYGGDIVAGGLLVCESREIARLLLDEVDADRWRMTIVVENVLQKRLPATARRQARLIRSHIDLMGPGLWDIVANGPQDDDTYALLATC